MIFLAFIFKIPFNFCSGEGQGMFSAAGRSVSPRRKPLRAAQPRAAKMSDGYLSRKEAYLK